MIRIAIILIAALLCARVVGQALPPALPPGFGACPLPCYAGIDLEHAAIVEARQKLATLSETRGTETEANSGIWVYSTQTYQVYLRTVQGNPASLGIASIQGPALIRLGDLIALLGSPTGSFLRRYGEDSRFDLWLTYRRPSMGIDVLFRGATELIPSLQAESVEIYRLDIPGGSNFWRPNVQWQGFSLRRLKASEWSLAD